MAVSTWASRKTRKLELTWFYRQGSLQRGDFETVVDSKIPSWEHTGLSVAHLQGGKSADLQASNLERIIVPLAGTFVVDYEIGGSHHLQKLTGRGSVFDGPTDTLYLPLGCSARITGVGRVAIAEAPATKAHKVRYFSAREVPVELRGAGASTRQVHNFGVPQSLDADRLIVCEVITPAENWSSYPPHKHDEYQEGVQSNLEEIYYFEVGLTKDHETQKGASPIGYFRNYGTLERPIETLTEVRSGDVALVPHGWHGPAMAAPGYDLYYLNIMAGPDPDRAWNIVDDPSHAWVRGTWQDQASDPRLPYKSRSTNDN